MDIDVIILSYATNAALKKVTEDCIQSLVTSEPSSSIRFNIVVLESERQLAPFKFEHSTTIYPTPKFNFHQYLNLGVEKTRSKFICFCNNDLLFHKNWASEIISAFQEDSSLLSASPFCSIFHPSIGFEENDGLKYGYGVRRELSGWCFMVKREIFDIIGKFDEHYSFWFADADYAKTLEKYKIRHALVTSSIVDHLDGTSTKELDEKQKKAMTTGQFWYFQYKWEHRNYVLYLYRQFRNYLRKAFI